MRIITILALFLLTISCKKKDVTELDSARIDNINQIVQTIFMEDSVRIFHEKSAIELLEKLRKFRVYVPSEKDLKMGVPPPPPPNIASINELMKMKIDGELFFSTKDSSNLINQYPKIDSLKIDEKVLKNIKSISTEKAKIKTKNGGKYYFCEMSIPLFSKDSNSAYVEVAYYCGGLCGFGKSIFLKKIEGKWTVIQAYESWVI